jgi:hypothetical protein
MSAIDAISIFEKAIKCILFVYDYLSVKKGAVVKPLLSIINCTNNYAADIEATPNGSITLQPAENSAAINVDSLCGT